MLAYVRHRNALERKRRSKLKCKEKARDSDFSIACMVRTGSSSRGDVGTMRGRVC